VEEGAVGGVNNIKSQRPASKEHRIDKDVLHNSSKKISSYFLLAKNCIKSLG
jgi:hypothetical protein